MRYETTARDFFYETTESALTYYITCEGVTIYSGVAVKSPNEPNLRINIGRRISDYLYTSMPDFREFDGVVVPHPEQLRDFILFDGEGNQLEEFRVLYEFSGELNESYLLSDPINTYADPRQKLFLTYTDAGSDSEFFYVIPDRYLVSYDSSGETITLSVFTNIEGVTFTVSGGTVGYDMAYTPTSFTFTTRPNTGDTPIIQEVYFYNVLGTRIFTVTLSQNYEVNDSFGSDQYNVPKLGCTEFAYTTYDNQPSSAFSTYCAAYFCAQKGEKSDIVVSYPNQAKALINYTDRNEGGVFYGHTLNDMNGGCVRGFDGTKANGLSSSGGTTVEYLWVGFIDGYFRGLGRADNRFSMINLKEIIFNGDYNGEPLTYQDSFLFGGVYSVYNMPLLERFIMPDYTYARRHHGDGTGSGVGTDELRNVFGKCYSLKYVKIAEGVIYISGFDSCNSLHTIIGPDLINVPGFSGTKPSNLQKVYVGGLTVSEFKTEVSNPSSNRRYAGIRESLSALSGTYLPYITLKDGIVKLKYDERGKCSLDE